VQSFATGDGFAPALVARHVFPRRQLPQQLSADHSIDVIGVADRATLKALLVLRHFFSAVNELTSFSQVGRPIRELTRSQG
jgi:hypothetical protein